MGMNNASTFCPPKWGQMFLVFFFFFEELYIDNFGTDILGIFWLVELDYFLGISSFE